MQEYNEITICEDAPIEIIKAEVTDAFLCIRNGKMSLKDIAAARLFPPDWCTRLGYCKRPAPRLVWWKTLRRFLNGSSKPSVNHLSHDGVKTLCGATIPHDNPEVEVIPRIGGRGKCLVCFRTAITRGYDV